MLTIWRRHTRTCPYRTRGRSVVKCNCPLFADGRVNGRRVRRALGTRDLARARRLAAGLESPEDRIFKSVADAVTAFLDHCDSEGLRFSTYRKYQNTLKHLRRFCEARDVEWIRGLTAELLDTFRAGRKLAPLTSVKELQLLRQFCGFCHDRRWVEENVARRIKPPRNIRSNEVEPYSQVEVNDIIGACDRIGMAQYERLRARAMVLLLHYTALRVGDVALLARDRVSADGMRCRIFLPTDKNRKAVFLPIPNELKIPLPLPRGCSESSKYFFWNGVSSDRSMKSVAERSLWSVFKVSSVQHPHAQRFRHTLATELLERGASFEMSPMCLATVPALCVSITRNGLQCGSHGSTSSCSECIVTRIGTAERSSRQFSSKTP
jgi:site-specific recombinase XerD